MKSYNGPSVRRRLQAIAMGQFLLAAAPMAALAQTEPAATSAFAHLATFDVSAGNGSAVAEIIDVTPDGRQLVYTDSEEQQIGFVDIANPWDPKAGGTVDVGGEPTSLAVTDSSVLVAVNTSESFGNPSGKLVVVSLATRAVVAELALGGQPDSIALAPDKLRAAIVIENERDEDENDGLLPQLPSGGLLIVDLAGPPATWKITAADLSPVVANAFAGDDLEPEFVDINEENEAVVTFQENNHLAVVDLLTGATISEFAADSVQLFDLDTLEDDLITLDGDIVKRREPDAVAWIDGDRFATANEGDYEDAEGVEGGSRGFTIFYQDGAVLYESGASFEHWLVAAGHYNEGRSENKGCEPEAVEVGTFDERTLLFVGSERCNVVAVYDVSDDPAVSAIVANAEPLQLLPTGIGPEGLKAIPDRGLLVASTETAEDGIPAQVAIYRMQPFGSHYPMIMSANDAAGLPIPWVALSGLAAHSIHPGLLYAVSDAFLARGYIYLIDVFSKPAQIIDRFPVLGSPDPGDSIESLGDLDLEGIAVGPDRSLWLASEGGDPEEGERGNLILKVDPLTGIVLQEITLPAELDDNRRSNGLEGIAVAADPRGQDDALFGLRELVYVVIQRAWPDTGDQDGVETKIGRYDVARQQWTFVYYPLEPEGNGGWVGLSELTPLPDGAFGVIERDKGWGPNAELKAVYRVDLANADFRPLDDPNGLATIDKSLLIDALPLMQDRSIWTAEKLEGFAVSWIGQMYAVTDNDGLDEATGETLFLRLGNFFLSGMGEE